MLMPSERHQRLSGAFPVLALLDSELYTFVSVISVFSGSSSSVSVPSLGTYFFLQQPTHQPLGPAVAKSVAPGSALANVLAHIQSKFERRLNCRDHLDPMAV